MESFARKVAAAAADLQYSSTAGTYPDQVFEKIVATDVIEPDTLPYFLEYDTEHGSIQRLLKRCMDVVGSVVLLLLAAPIMALTAIAIKATSPGPVIYRQMRLGRKGVPFVFYKFRSMTRGADENVHREYVTRLIEGKNDEVNQGDAEKPVYKLQGDSRITRVGFFIRKTSIDELPQLFNVLKGDLSLVGPRPPIGYEAELYQPWHLRRILEGRPGITGLWQVEGRNRVSFDEMVRMDLRYTRTWTLWMDIKILVKTVGAVLRLDGDK
jgi:lipopolysaccharide/colanic/teichoic acid biosynthesis glycosyltransferase